MIPITFYQFTKKPNSTKQPYAGPTVFDITASQEGEGTPSPSNVRPIHPGLSFRLDNNQMLDVYGGSINLNTGVLTVTWLGVDLGQLEWTYSSVRKIFMTNSPIANIRIPLATSAKPTWCKCEIYKIETATDVYNSAESYDLSIAILNNGSLVVSDQNYTDATQFKSAVNGKIFTSEMVTPQTMTLSQSELSRAAAALGVPWPFYPPIMYQADNCELIEDTSIINPKIRWHAHDSKNPYEFNYCYIPEFGRFYFVTNVTYQLGTWVLDLSVDVLATGRDIIGPSSQYILRSAYTFDGAIEDAMYPVKSDFVTAEYLTYDEAHQGLVAPVYCDIDSLGQWYVVGIIGSDTSSAENNGSVTYYVLDQTQFNESLNWLLGTVSIYGVPVSELSEQLQRQLLNPLQYIASVTLYPFKPEVVQEDNADKQFTQIQLGMTTLSVGALTSGGFRMLKRANSYTGIYDSTLTGWISHHSVATTVYLHPQYGARGKWVLGKPYTKYIVVVEPWGTIEVPGDIVLDAYKYTDQSGDPYIVLTFHTYFDASTGACRLEITTSMDDGTIIPWYIETVNLGIDVPCHQAVQDVMTYRKSLYDLAYAKKTSALDVGLGAASALTMGILGGGANQGAQISQASGIIGGVGQAVRAGINYSYQNEPAAIANLQSANYPAISGSGSSKDSFMSQARDICSPRVFAYWAVLADDNNTDYGRPLCTIRQISTIPGFIICDNAHIQSRLTVTENQMIEDFMNGGFYYE